MIAALATGQARAHFTFEVLREDPGGGHLVSFKPSSDPKSVIGFDTVTGEAVLKVTTDTRVDPGADPTHFNPSVLVIKTMTIEIAVPVPTFTYGIDTSDGAILLAGVDQNGGCPRRWGAASVRG
jgi:hypothetical protein